MDMALGYSILRRFCEGLALNRDEGYVRPQAARYESSPASAALPNVPFRRAIK